MNRSANHAGEPSLKDTTVATLEKEEEVKKGKESIISNPTPVLNCERPQRADHREAENNMLAGFFCMLCPASFRVVFWPPHAGWNDGRGAEGWGVKSITAG